MIVLIRHAEVEWVDESTRTIVRDPSLSERGRKQLPYLCEFLSHVHLNDFVYSPQQRVLETFGQVRRVLTCTAESGPWLEEIRYPDWSGADPDEIRSVLDSMDGADAVTRWRGFEGGESLRSYTKRIRRGLLDYLATVGVTPGTTLGLWCLEDSARSIGMLGHIGSLSIVTGVLLGLPAVPWARQRFPLRQASVTHIEPVRVGKEWAFSIQELGRDDFIPPDLRSTT